MAHNGSETGSARSRYWAVLLAALSVVTFVALGVAFTNASSASQIAHNAELLHWSNVTSGSAAVARAALSQALVFTIDRQLGVASEESNEVALSEARAAFERLDASLSAIPDDATTMTEGITLLLAGGDRILDALENGDVPAADEVLATSFEPTYAAVAADLGTAQARYSARITDAETVASRIESFTRWLVTLLIPAAAIVLYRSVVRRKLRERQRELEAQLAADRELMQAKDELIAGISHELRTPLTGIVGFSHHLVDTELADREESLELVSMIQDDSEELSRMVDDLLTAARLDAGALTHERTQIDVAAEVDTVVERLRAQGRLIEITGRGVYAAGDPDRFRQIMRNLLSNARRHGGSAIEISLASGEDMVVVEVRDNGAGVTGEVEERLFERFVHDGRTSVVTGSVGLGLSIARSLARAMDGDVQYERRDGWTVFRTELPAAPQPPAEAPRGRAVTEPTPAGRTALVDRGSVVVDVRG